MRNTEKITLSITETAAVLGLSRPTVYRLVKSDGFPAFRVGTRTLIPRAGLERWVQEQGDYRREVI